MQERPVLGREGECSAALCLSRLLHLDSLPDRHELKSTNSIPVNIIYINIRPPRQARTQKHELHTCRVEGLGFRLGFRD